MAGQYPPQGPYPPHQPSGAPNPYSSPAYAAAVPGGPDLRQRVHGKVTVPAVALIVVGALGLLMTFYSLVISFQPPPPPDPELPEWANAFRQGGHGPMAAAIQLVFLVVNILILVGAVSMIRFSNWGLAMTASILAMVNLGNCCCLLGLPVGIWATVVLSSSDVKAAFQAGKRTSGYMQPPGGYPPQGPPQQPMPPQGR